MYSRGRGILDRLPLEEHLLWISSMAAEKGDNADHDDRLKVQRPSNPSTRANLLRRGLCLGVQGKGRLIRFQKEWKE